MLAGAACIAYFAATYASMCVSSTCGVLPKCYSSHDTGCPQSAKEWDFYDDVERKEVCCALDIEPGDPRITPEQCLVRVGYKAYLHKALPKWATEGAWAACNAVRSADRLLAREITEPTLEKGFETRDLNCYHCQHGPCGCCDDAPISVLGPVYGPNFMANLALLPAYLDDMAVQSQPNATRGSYATCMSAMYGESADYVCQKAGETNPELDAVCVSLLPTTNTARVAWR